LDRSAIILAGGSSSRFGQDKGLLLLSKQPLIKHVLHTLANIADENIVVVSSDAKTKNYARIVGPSARILIDTCDQSGPLAGVLTGLEEAKGQYAVLLPCDTPMVSREILLLLFELCINKNAAIPRWPNGYIEPLQAVYRTKAASQAAKEAINEGKLEMRAMIDKLYGIRYVSTLVLQQLDPDLNTFFNVNTHLDLKKAEFILRKIEKQKHS
jgi:molybdopterin-guanine dinucleotide biosynthesis protein A